MIVAFNAPYKSSRIASRIDKGVDASVSYIMVKVHTNDQMDGGRKKSPQDHRYILWAYFVQMKC